MKKTKLFFVSLLSVAMLSTGTVVYAAQCSMCAIYGVDATLITNGEHLWTNHQSHTATYSENGVLKNEKCYITISEDKYTWTCPNGHGIVTTRVRHRESHTCKHCESLDYFK